jgi:hypothetical protein
VLAYLSRYTDRVAIANSRLIALDGNRVTFRWKDYRAEGADRFKTMTLAVDEFIRRFLIHVLPAGFHRIRQHVSTPLDRCWDAVSTRRTFASIANCSNSESV